MSKSRVYGNKKTSPVIDDDDSDDTGLISSKPKFSEGTDKSKELRYVRSITPRDLVIKWYQDEYTKQWKFNPMTNIAKADTNKYISSVLRMHNISTMKHKFIYNTMDMIVVVMKLYDYGLKKETNYGTLFCEVYDNITPMRQNMILPNAVVNKIAFTFYSASPSHISCDGEYRSRFSLFNCLVHAKQSFADIWNELEEYVNRIKIRRRWSLYASYFYPKLEQEHKSTDVEYAVKTELLPVTLLIVSWFHTIFDEMLNMSRTHINQVYVDIMLQNKETDIEFMQELIKKYGGERMELFRATVSHTKLNFQSNQQHMQCGYKMIPLNYKEVQDPMRLRYKPWREYFISSKCNDLVINSISPTFPITLDWFYIKNSRKGLYDNKSQYNRLKNSELAKDILHILYEAQRGTYFATENMQSVNKNSKDIKQWISSKFRKLSEKIDEPINYSVEEIIMSEVTLAFASEYVGRTVADSVVLVQKSKIYDSMLGHPFKESGYDYFAKYMFEICYGLLCVNSKFGVIHGDFHLNNATIGALYYFDPLIMANKDKKNKVVYVFDDENQFVFPNNGYFSSVIDFSRGIIDPSRYEELIDISLPATQKLVENFDKFRVTEMSTLLNLYVQMFPSKQRQREELVVLFKNNFNAVFKLLTCIDLYMFTIRLSRMLQKVKIPIYKKVISLVEKLNRLSESYIATEMNHLINDTAVYSKKIEESEYPILTIIKKCFPEYIDGKVYKSIGTITDVYVYNNPMTYSIAKYEKFPEFLKHVKYYDKKTNKLVIVPKVSEIRKTNRVEYENQKNHNLEMVSYISMRHSQKSA
jgi:hypothetical protein